MKNGLTQSAGLAALGGITILSDNSWEGSILDSAIKYGLVTKRGSWLSFGEEQLGQGHEGARSRLETDPELAQKIIEKVKEKVAAGGIVTAAIPQENES